MGLRHIRSHTGLRGIAAVLVVFYHLHFGSGFRFPFEAEGGFISRSYIFVDLFFILSGFIISYTNNAERPTPFERTETGEFALHRFVRLYPQHIFSLTLTVAVILSIFALEVAFDPGKRAGFWTNDKVMSLLSQALLVHSWGPKEWVAWNIPSWSISAEIFAYLLFVPLVWVRQRGVAYFTGISILIAALFYLHAAKNVGNLDIVHGLAPFRCLAGFVLGMNAYFLRRHITECPPSILDFLQILSIACIVFILIFNLNDIFIIFPFLFLVYTTWTDVGVVCLLLSKPVFQFLGRVSYSVYLNHIPVILALSFVFERTKKLVAVEYEPILRAAYLALVLCAVVALSYCTYNLVEEPFRKLGSRRRRSGAVAPALHVRIDI